MLTVPQQTREPTPTPSWNIGSPASSSDRRSSRRIPHSNTFNSMGTADTNTSIEIPTGQSARSKVRLSFLKRSTSQTQQVQEAVLAPITNGNTNGSPLQVIKDVTPQKAGISTDTTPRGRGDTTTTRSRSRSKENQRHSYFHRTDKEEESSWVTSSDLHSRTDTQSRGDANSRSASTIKQKESPVRRSSSSQRPETGVSSPSTGSVGRGVSSVKKRLSLLKLGKKNSKGNLLMGGLREED